MLAAEEVGLRTIRSVSPHFNVLVNAIGGAGPQMKQYAEANCKQPPGIRITRGDQPSTPYQLLPPEAFPETQPDRVEREVVDGIPSHETGPDSRTVRARLASSCAGWPSPPDAPEFYAAVRSSQPSVRQCAIVRTWAREASSGDIVRGWLEEAYTWPMLVAALHRTDAGHPALNELLNGFAKAEWAAGRQ